MIIYEDVCWSDLFEGGGSRATVEPLAVTENGMYTAPGGVVYSPVTVNVSLGPDDGGDKPFDQMTWSQIVASTKTGKYKSFEIGQMAPMDLGDSGTVHMQIAGIDKDILADGSGNAALSLIIKENVGAIESGSTSYWPESAYYRYLHETLWPRLPQVVRENIKAVTKYTNTYRNGSLVTNFESTETIWAPSFHEVRTDVLTIETMGVTYGELFPNNASRIKYRLTHGDAAAWLLRSAYRESTMRTVTTSGATGSASSSSTQYKAVFGFCL